MAPNVKRMQARRAPGFTLIELLIAMAIFVIMAAAMYGGTTWIIEEREIVTARAAELEELQRTVRRIQNDFSQAYPRAVRDELGRGQVVAVVTERTDGLQLRMTRSGWRNPVNRNRANLQRVQYRYDDEEQALYRDTWPVLDRVLGAEPDEQQVLSGLTDFDVEFLDDNGNWVQDWPAADSSSLTAMPRAVRYRLETEAFGEVVRVVQVPG